MTATYRPAGVAFAAIWAAVSGCLNFLMAFGAGLVGGIAPGIAIIALIVAAFQALLGVGMLVLAVGLYKVQSWARTVGIVLFGLFSVLNLVSLIGGTALAVVFLGLNVTAMLLLVVNGDAFGGRARADISAGTASSYRPGR